MTKSWASKTNFMKGAVFTAMGVYMMSVWAKKKKRMLLDSIQGTDDKLEVKLKKKSVLVPGLF